MSYRSNLMSNQDFVSNLTQEACAEILERWLEKFRLELEFSNVIHIRGKWKLENRNIPEAHMVFTCGGGGTYFFTGRKVELCKDRLIFIGPGVPHSGWADPAHLPFLMTCRFKLFDSNRQLIEAFPEPLAMMFEVSGSGLFMSLFERMFRYYHLTHPRIRKVLSNAVLRQIIGEIVLDLSTARMPDPKLDELHNKLMSHPEKRFSIDEMSEIAGCSRKTFLSRFREAYGETPVGYQIKLRCRTAAEHLLESSMSIKEIAAGLSYPDQYAFSKQFKKVIGSSPSAYRAKAYRKP